MTRRLLLATRNQAKLAELRRLVTVDASSSDVTVLGLADVPAVAEVPETGATFRENAERKAREYARATGLVCVADDSGIAVDALSGMPGVLSARWAGRHGDDDANTALLLAQLEDVPDDRRGAAFVCVAVAATPDGRTVVSTGEVRGTVLRERRGTGGFGYDPVFVPDGHARTTAQMPSQEKDALSHRGVAVRALVPRLRALLA